MGFFTLPELNTRLGTLRAYHLAAIVLWVAGSLLISTVVFNRLIHVT
jgi:hypothetical protein